MDGEHHVIGQKMRRLPQLIGRISRTLSRREHVSTPARAWVLALSLSVLCPGPLALGAPVDLGELTPFYRGTQLQGHIFGQGLVDIPAYLTAGDIDIRYRKNPALRKEIPFVDTFSINRFLGGYKPQWIKQYGNWDPSLGNASLDYVVRGSDGQLKNRPDILRRHLQPYIDAGYKLDAITINLENVPWAIARSEGTEGPFGQRNPPKNIDDWRWTVRHLAEDLKSMYGAHGTPHFKIGNEFNTKKSFNGTTQDYVDLYTTSYQALRQVFPHTSVVPGEFSGTGACHNFDVCVYDVKDFLSRANALDAAPNYLPRSLHAFQNIPRNVMPSQTVQRAVSSYRGLERGHPEIHQFGLLGQPFGAFAQFGSDASVRQAAWQFQVLMGLWGTLRPARVFHWGGVSVYQNGKTPLLNGTGFLRLFLDRYLGRRMYRLAVTPERDANTEIAAVAFTRNGAQAIMVSSFSLSAGEGRTKVTVEMPEPANLSGWRYTVLDSAADAFLAIRRDLAAAGNLKPQFAQCATCTAEPRSMAVDAAAAQTMIATREEQYEQAIQTTLRWKPIDQLTSLERDTRSGKLRLELSNNELLILESPQAAQ
jgi:hypothetical protein